MISIVTINVVGRLFLRCRSISYHYQSCTASKTYCFGDEDEGAYILGAGSRHFPIISFRSHQSGNCDFSCVISAEAAWLFLAGGAIA